MIEQSHRPLLPTGLQDLDSLQRRANRGRVRYQRVNGSSTLQWQQLQQALRSPLRTLSRIPTRYFLHGAVMLALPVAVALSQIRPGVMLPTAQPIVTQGSADLAVPASPLGMDDTLVGDPPLDDAEIPAPDSLVSRSEAFAPVVVDAMIAGDMIYLRNGPGTDYDAVARMAKDTPVEVIGTYNDWYQIREAPGKPVYWVSGALLDMADGAQYTVFQIEQSAIPAPPPPKVATVREEGLQMRDGPGTNYVSMSKFSAGQQIELLERYQDWYHVGIPGGADGWVKGEFLNIDAAINNRLLDAISIPDPNPALVGRTREDQINLRQGPDSKYAKVAMINAGAQLDLVGKYNDWYKVKLADGKAAWVFRDYLDVTERVARRVGVTKDFPALPKAVAKTTTKSGKSGGTINFSNVPVSGDLASYALNFVGARYRYGGTSPSGFDCSGLTSYVYAKYGVRLPRTAASQYGAGTKVGPGELQPGDLVFFTGTAAKRGITHVGIYIGGGKMVHASTPRYGVQVSSLNSSYYQSHYYGAVRPR
ncbi:SH3 domain-containing protein [Chloroflexia bacterium SDU3-3]|nr:SH3 domain-containing protein [Chloroflexia bacterium SDU3-3]